MYKWMPLELATDNVEVEEVRYMHNPELDELFTTYKDQQVKCRQAFQERKEWLKFHGDPMEDARSIQATKDPETQAGIDTGTSSSS